MGSSRHGIGIVLRLLACCVVLGWGWFILAHFRTQRFGFSFEVLLLAGMFVLPATLLPFLGLRPSTIGVGSVVLLLFTMALSEGMAGYEEWRFRQEQAGVSTDAEWVFRDRQWPFSHHAMIYHPRTGHFFGAD